MRPTRSRSLVPVLVLVGLLTGLGPALADPFADHWFAGTAEITTYTLEQARYGEVHPGDAALIYVTEDFSRSKHVKLDNPTAAGDDRVPVLKLNFTKTFNTGVYPYSMMTSVFSPLDTGNQSSALKITTTSQEWCGHTFTQLNRTDAGYRIREYSYFESEGDRAVQLTTDLTEDGLWTLLRLDPEALPLGSIELIPGTMVQRLLHQPWVLRQAEASLTRHVDNPGLRTYKLSYPQLGRTLEIHFQSEFPHAIEGWEETYRSGWGAGAQVLTTRAVRNQRRMLDYWNRHDLDDAPLRRELGLEP